MAQRLQQLKQTTLFTIRPVFGLVQSTGVDYFDNDCTCTQTTIGRLSNGRHGRNTTSSQALQTLSKVVAQIHGGHSQTAIHQLMNQGVKSCPAFLMRNQCPCWPQQQVILRSAGTWTQHARHLCAQAGTSNSGQSIPKMMPNSTTNTTGQGSLQLFKSTALLINFCMTPKATIWPAALQERHNLSKFGVFHTCAVQRTIELPSNTSPCTSQQSFTHTVLVQPQDSPCLHLPQEDGV